MKKQVLIYDDNGVVIAMLLRFTSGNLIKYIDCFAQQERALKKAKNLLQKFETKLIDYKVFLEVVDDFSKGKLWGFSVVDYNSKRLNWTREVKQFHQRLNPSLIHFTLNKVRKEQM
jgi:hypothetical protein